LEPDRNSPQPDSTPRLKTTKTALRFAGIGTTLASAIGLGALGGKQADDHFQLDKPLGTAAGAILGLALGMWSVLRNIQAK
tara:strand:- start:301 stop:543 length:243 start_codon:yes stop_codon:yes gene_type:complete